MTTLLSINESGHMAIRAPKAFGCLFQRVPVASILANSFDLLIGISKLPALLPRRSQTLFYRPTSFQSITHRGNRQLSIFSQIRQRFGLYVKRFRQRSLDGPIRVQSHSQSAFGQTNFSSPLRDGLSSTVQRQVAVSSLVVCLLKVGSPFTVVGFVISVVVDSVYRVLRRGAAAHISEKGQEIIPSFAYTNSTSAVIPERCQIRVVASRLHVLPSDVFRRLAEAVPDVWASRSAAVRRSFHLGVFYHIPL